jgi:hypothetical protein
MRSHPSLAAAVSVAGGGPPPPVRQPIDFALRMTGILPAPFRRCSPAPSTASRSPSPSALRLRGRICVGSTLLGAGGGRD